jgi:SdrD B-like domain
VRYAMGCLLFILLVTTAVSSGASSLNDSVMIYPIRRSAVAPGVYTTLAFELTNKSSIDVHVRAELELPLEWDTVTATRDVIISARKSIVIPFTIRPASFAHAGRTHVAQLILLDEHDEVIARTIALLKVKPTENLELKAIGAQSPIHPGETLHHQFQLTNNGNVEVVPSIEYESIPDYDTHISWERTALEPGESRLVVVNVDIPESAPARHSHVLELRASPGLSKSMSVRTITDVYASQPAVPTYQRLPLDVQAYREHTGAGLDIVGFRLNTGGMLWPETRADLDLHLQSQSHNGSEKGWEQQRVRFDLNRPHWRATGGDLQEEFSPLTMRTLWGRGARVEHEHGWYKIGLYGVEDRDPLSRRTYATKFVSRLSEKVALAGEAGYQESGGETTTLEGDRRLSAASVIYHGGPLAVEATASWSRQDDGTRITNGEAAQFRATLDRSWFYMNTRAYTGTENFTGANGDRDGLLSHMRVSPRLGWIGAESGHPLPYRPISLWISHDRHQGHTSMYDLATIEQIRRTRLGAQISHRSWPAVELSAGHERRRQNEEEQHLVRQSLRISTWQAIEQIMLAGHIEWGDIRDHSRNQHGSLSEWGVSAGGRWHRLHGTLRWAAEQEWIPETQNEHRRRTMGTDVTWSDARGRWSAGVGLEVREDRGDIDQPDWDEDVLLRPRIEWRFYEGLSLRYEHGFRDESGGLTTETARIQLNWAANSGLPVLWQPVRAGLKGMVFIDEDMDGYPDPGEVAVEHVGLILEGRHLLTDSYGNFEDSELEPGLFWLELNTNTLPPGLRPIQSFPMTLMIEPGQVQEILIPLVRSSSLSGMIYQDRNRDGNLNPNEPGMTRVLVLLKQGETVVRNAQTRADGAYFFEDVLPGVYEVTLDHGWLPNGWKPTGDEKVTCLLAAGDHQQAVAIGVAPRSKPIIKTYHDAAPEADGLELKRIKSTIQSREPVPITGDTKPNIRSIIFLTRAANTGGEPTIEQILYRYILSGCRYKSSP